MMRAVAFLAVSAFCYAQVRKPCQSPQQWEGKVIRMDRTNKNPVIANIVYDGSNKRIRIIDEVSVGSNKEFYKTIRLNNVGREYIVNLKTNVCNVSSITRPWRPLGVPSNSKFMFEADLGLSAVPSEHITTSTWEGTFADGTKYIVRATEPGCGPLTMDVFGNNTDDNFGERYYNITAGITDPAIFITPKECESM